jgi:thiamine-phosphate pyrophosphorylase
MAWPSRPIVCAVSDRSRLPPPAAGARGERFEAVRDRLVLAAEAGADLLQVREPDLSAAELAELVGGLVERTRETAARVLVNDRADVALAAGAHGVHLKAESMETARVRALAPAGFLVGRSVHSLAEARAAEQAGADYLVFGTVFPTRSKPEGHPAAGLDALASVVAGVHVPVLAVGGVTTGQAPAVAATGAAGIAAIGMFFEPWGPAERVREQLEARVSAVRRAFVGSRSSAS